MKVRFLALVLLCSSAQAYVAFVPLDSRPATRILPEKIAALSGQEVQSPPRAMLGGAQSSADLAALTAWLEAHRDADRLFIALDALAYGGLVQSRSSTLSAKQALENLEPVRTYAATGKPVYASITIPRHPDAKDRARNLEVIRAMLEWARSGVFRELRVTWDDALKGSPAPQEGADLAKTAPSNVRVYPGADEVLSSLFAAALCEGDKRLRVVYSDPSKAKDVIAYDGLPLEDSAKLHAASNRFTVVSADAPDLTLYIFNGGDPREAALEVNALTRAGEVSVVDMARVNVGTPAFWRDLRTLGALQKLSSFAAWGTPGNNLGTALAQARLWLEHGDVQKNRDLLAYAYQNDILYSSATRFEVRKAFPEASLNTPAAQDWLFRASGAEKQLRFPGGEYLLESIFLPWNRSFEAESALEFAPAAEGLR